MISVILPTYNEKENIVELVEAIQKSVGVRNEVIVVDDDSPDGTADVVKDFINKSKTSSCRLIVRKNNHGLRNSIWEGIQKAKGDKVVWMDADFSHPPEVIPQMIKAKTKEVDVVVASRFVHGGKAKEVNNSSGESVLAVYLSRFLNMFLGYLFRFSFGDFTSGFVLADKKVFKKVKFEGDYGEYFIDFIVKAKLNGFDIIEIPYVSVPRKYGETKTATNTKQLLTRGVRYLTTIYKLLTIKYFGKK